MQVHNALWGDTLVCLRHCRTAERPYLSLLLLVPILVGVPLERGLLVSAKSLSTLEMESQAWKNTSSLKKICAVGRATERPQFVIPHEDQEKNRSLLNSHDSPACMIFSGYNLHTVIVYPARESIELRDQAKHQ